MKKALTIIGLLIASVMLICCNSGKTADADSLPKDSATIAKGKSSFINNCNICHNFEQDATGPHLATVTARESVEWIRNFIKDPKKIIDGGDTTAQELYKRYKTLMPSFGQLPDDEINSIIAYIHTQKNELARVDTTSIKNPIPDTITTSDLKVGLTYFAQIPPSSNEKPVTRIVELDHQPVTGDLYVLDLRGKLYKLENDQPKVYMDMGTLKPKFINEPGLNTGFGNFAFHPDFATNGLIYTTHTESPGSAKADFNFPDSVAVTVQWVVTEWKTDPKGFPFAGKSRELFRIDMPTGIHGVQEIAFDPQAKKGSDEYGLLYVGIGDGGSSEMDHPLVSEMPDQIWGSVVRIDPSGHNSKNGQYGIPAKNPFVKDSAKKYQGEIYAWGFRNPHRFSWTKSHQLLVANIGQSNIESVNLIAPGHFYGWPLREGEFVEHFYKGIGKIYPLPENDSIYHINYPVAEFDHDEGTAIAGGFEYTGSLVPQLKGKYIFNDISTGKLFFVNVSDLHQGTKATIKKWNITINDTLTTLVHLAKSDRVEARFGVDKKNELYLFTKADGKIYRLVK